MGWNRIEGNWKHFNGKVKEQWGHLTDDHLEKIAGRRDQLEGKIQNNVMRSFAGATLSASTLERNSFRIGEVFALL